MIFKSNYNIGTEMFDVQTGISFIPGSTDQRHKEVNTLPSETIPGQAMSIQDMLKRIASGLPITSHVPIFEGDENMDDSELQGHPDLSKMDLVDREEYIESQQERLDALKEKFAKEKAHRAKLAERTKAPTPDQGPKDAQPRGSDTEHISYKNPAPRLPGAAGGNTHQTSPNQSE